MILSDMLTLLRFYVDDTVEDVIGTVLLNAGQNRMAAEVNANFPQLNLANVNDTFVFDERYHEMPIIYAAAMFKGYDSSIREKESYMGQFQSMLPNFTENYKILPRYREDFNVQQFVATAAQMVFMITKEGFDPSASFLRVYVNDLLVDHRANSDGSFTIDATVAGDYVTAIWETHMEILRPPYGWWGGLA